MKVKFAGTFVRDLKKLSDAKIAERVQQLIEEVEQVQSIDQIGHVKKMQGAEGFFCIRINDYRIGIQIRDDEITFRSVPQPARNLPLLSTLSS